MKTGWIKKIRNAGISLMTTAAVLTGMVSGIPMHAHADATNYPLYIGGYQFNSDRLIIDNTVNAAFSGTAHYDPDNNVLTLNNFNNGGIAWRTSRYNCYGIAYEGTENLTIRIVGDNTITTGKIATADCYTREGFNSPEKEADITIIGSSFADTLNVYPGDNTFPTSNNDSIGFEVAGDLLIKDCSVNAFAGGSRFWTLGIMLWDEKSLATSGTLTIDHASVTAKGGDFNATAIGSAAAPTSSCGIYSDMAVIKNGSIVNASAGTKEQTDSINAGIYSRILTISNSNVDADSKYDCAISAVVKNEVPGRGWTDVAGTEGETPIPAQAPGESGPSLATYKKVHLAPVYTATVNYGTGSDDYEYGKTVTITAEELDGGKVFDRWISEDGVAFADASSSTTTFTMPAKPVTVTAVYRNAGVVATPVFTPAAGSYALPQNVTISCADDDAEIYYTTDGKTPTKASEKYSAAINVTETKTIKAIAVKNRMTDSPVAEAAYTITIDIPVLYFVTVNNGTGKGHYQAGETVTITADAPEEGKVFDVWTSEDGVVFADASASTTTFKMLSKKMTVTATYRDAGTVATPVFTPVAGTYSSAQNLKISCATSGADIYYTTDGSEPTTGSAEYNGAIPVSSDTTIKAIAAKGGMANSAVATAKYSFTEIPGTKYKVIVIDGTGKGNYESGATVSITAKDPESGKVFDGWTSEDGVIFADAKSATTIFTMPAKPVTVKANFKDAETKTSYKVTVTGGTGGGEYAEGEKVTIKADDPADGKVFDKWTTSDEVTLEDETAASTTFTMPAGDVSVTATYKDKPHEHNMTHHPAVAATQTSAGNIEYWECEGCKKLFSDKDGKNEITLDKTVLDILPDPLITPAPAAPVASEGTINEKAVKIETEVKYPQAVTWTGGNITKEQLGVLADDGKAAKVTITGLSDAISKIKPGTDPMKYFTIGYDIKGKDVGKANFTVKIKLNAKALKKAKVSKADREALADLVNKLNEDLAKDVHEFEVAPINLADDKNVDVKIKATLKNKKIQVNEADGTLKAVKSVTITYKVPAGKDKNGKPKYKKKTYTYKKNKVNGKFVINVTDPAAKKVSITATDTNLTFGGTRTDIVVKK